MARKKEAPAQSYWKERWLNYIWFDLFGFDENERPSVRRRAGIQLTFSAGRITAEIPSGRYGHHCKTSFRVKPLGKRAWKQVLDKLTTTPQALQQLLAGRPGEELEAIMDSLGHDLFPIVDEFDAFRCDCDHGSCSHRAYLVNAVAEQLPEIPFLWLNVMGLERGELLAGISARQADAIDAPEGAALAADRFWSTPVDLDQIPVRPGEALAPGALLLRLGPLPLPEPSSIVTLVEKKAVKLNGGDYTIQDLVQVPADEVLSRYARLIGRGAAELALADRLTVIAPAKLPGKSVPAKQRLLPEILKAVQEAGQPVPISMLRLYSPTAGVLSDGLSQRGLLDAVAELPEPYRLVGRFYVADRSKLLEGARFRHTVSFTEWYERRLRLDSDWVRALQAAGLHPPFQLVVGDRRFSLDPDGEPTEDQADLFAALGSNLGEELELTHLDPVLPLLSITRRSHATPPAAQAATDLRALALLHESVSLNGSLEEVEGAGLLLAAGSYAAETPPNPVWLLALLSGQAGPVVAGPDRRLITDPWRGWKPRYGRKPYGYWSSQEKQVQDYATMLRAKGIWNPEQLNIAKRWLHDWVRTNPGAQDTLAGAVPLASFLYYLWIELPALAGENSWSTDRIPELFAGWFTYLARDQQALADHYRPHLAACALTQQFEHRLQTRSKEVPWYAEGLLWIGPELIFQT